MNFQKFSFLLRNKIYFGSAAADSFSISSCYSGLILTFKPLQRAFPCLLVAITEGFLFSGFHDSSCFDLCTNVYMFPLCRQASRFASSIMAGFRLFFRFVSHEPVHRVFSLVVSCYGGLFYFSQAIVCMFLLRRKVFTSFPLWR